MTVFEARTVLGGLWSGSLTENPNTNSSSRFSLNPLMRTNLSRFTVGFSDLAWESVIHRHEHGHVPMFPQAWQVGKYLERYAEMYIPPSVLRLRHRVLRTIRIDQKEKKKTGWTVYWVIEGEKHNQNQQVEMPEEFDFLVVASGFFSRPYIPDIPGLLSFEDRTVHSSSLHDLDSLLPFLGQSCDEKPASTKKLVVIGGSMSGVEAASTLALRISSSRFTSDKSWTGYEVHHICTKPFWVLPTYLPQTATNTDPEGKERMVSFLPLDLVMYDLSRRSPGSDERPIEYSIGPVTPEQADGVNEYFRSLLGGNYFGDENLPEDNPRPPWVGISNDYPEFVRSGMIKVTIARASAVLPHSNSPSEPDLAKLGLNLPNGQTKTLDNVAAIVIATGFTPFTSLPFLPGDILDTLEYSETDAFCPLILDGGGGGSMHSEISDLGFVGFYRGPYWGVMEMQARSLGMNWAGGHEQQQQQHLSKTELEENEKKNQRRENERSRLRALRHADPEFQRGQFPMSDYVGLMESCARDLGISRTGIPGMHSGRSGSVVPSRYPFDNRGSLSSSPCSEGAKESEMRTTLNSLRVVLYPEYNTDSPGLALAIFRALQGTWVFKRRELVYPDQSRGSDQSLPGNNNNNNNSKRVLESGTATFHPRYPTSPVYEKEYVYEEEIEYSCNNTTGFSSHPHPNNKTTRSIYRFQEETTTSEPRSENTHIHIWSLDIEEKDSPLAGKFLHGLRFTSAYQRMQHGEPVAGEYLVRACGEHEYNYGYMFYLKGVQISSWECTVIYMDTGGLSMRTQKHSDDGNEGSSWCISTKTVYRR